MVSLFERAKSLGVELITLHNPGGVFPSKFRSYLLRCIIYQELMCYVQGKLSIAAQLKEYDLLDSSILLSHATNLASGDVALIKSANAHISTTPSTELQMMGEPIAFSHKHDIQSHTSIGVDCHSATSGSLVSEMRLLLQSARGFHNVLISESGKIPLHVSKSVLEVFNLGTIAGARAIGEEATIGSLAEGKLADIVVFDALSPAMVGVAQQDPVAAVVLHSSPADIEMVFVDGVVRKNKGRLTDTSVAKAHAKWTGDKTTVGWVDVAKEIIVRRKLMAENLARIDMIKSQEGVVEVFHINPELIAN